MLSITLGPIALPLGPLLLLGSLTLAGWLAHRLAPVPWRRASEHSVWLAAAAGLLAARAGHVARHAQAYASEPLSMLDLRDGGWLLAAGLVAAGGVLAWRLHRHRAAARATALAAACGLGLWLGLGALTAGLSPPAHLPQLAQAVLQPLPPLAAPSPSVRTDAGQASLPRTPHPAAPATAPSAASTLAGLQDGRPLVVNLWATWCAPCRAEMPVLAEAQQARPDLRFVFANQGEDAAAVRRFLAGQGLVLHDVWLDTGSALGPALGSRALPTTVFFDAQGQQVDAHVGVLNAAALQARLARWPVAAAARP